MSISIEGLKFDEFLSEIDFVAYIRKSTDREDKQVQSLDTQRKILEKIAERYNIKIVEYIEEARSAKNPADRDGFNRMVVNIKEGKYQGVLVIAPDRLSRNAIDAGVLAELMSGGMLKVIVTQSNMYDPSPMSVLMLQFSMLSAKFQNDSNALKVSSGLLSKVEKGWFPGVAPQGYLNTKHEDKGRNKIIKDSKRFHQVRKLWDMMLTGSYTINELVEIADKKWKYRSVKRNKVGGAPISRSGLYTIFSNPFYYGHFRYRGKLWKGAHVPMVTKKEFEKVQEILGRKNKRRPKTHEHIYTGLLKCPCGASITATHKEKYYPKTDNYGVYDYLHCTRKVNSDCEQPSVTLEKFENQLVEILSSIEIPEEFKDWATIYLVEKSKYETQSSMRILESQQKEYTSVEKQLSELLDMRMNKEITPSEYSARKVDLESVRDDLKDTFEGAEHARDQFRKEVEEVFDFACSAREKMEEGGIAEKREILAKLGQNLLLKDGKLCVDLKKPFLVFKESKKADYFKNKGLEPVEVPVMTAKYGVSEPENIQWLPRLDSNQRPSA